MSIPTADSSRAREDSVAHGTLAFIAVQSAFLLGGYIIHFYLGRWLGPVNYGDFGVVMGLLVWLEVSLAGGFPYVIRKFGAENPALMPSIACAAIRGQAVYSILLFAAAMVAAPRVAWLMHDPRLTNLIRLACADIPFFGFYFTYNAILNGRRQFSRQATAMVAYAAVKLAAVLALVTIGLGVEGALIGNILASVGGTVIAAFYVGRLPKAAPYPIKKLMRYAGGTAALAVSFSLLIHLDLFMVKAIGRSAVNTGFYTAAGTLAHAPFMVFIGIAGAALPAIANAASRADHALVSRYISQSLRLHMLMLMPTTAILAGTSSGLVELVYSSRYAPAGPVLAMLAAAMMLFGFLNTLYNAIVALGDTRCPLIGAAAMIALTVGLDFALIPRMGMMGAATASLVASVAGLVVACALCGRRIGTNVISFASVGRIAGAAAVVYGLARMIPLHGLLLLPFCVLLLAVYIVIVALLREITPEDIASVGGVIGTRRWRKLATEENAGLQAEEQG